MKATCKIIPCLWVLKTTLVLMALWTTFLFAQKMPPAPKEPVSDLKMPEPVLFQEIKGKATLPAQLKLGFNLDLAERIKTGNWDVNGKVAAVDSEKVVFVTERGEAGNLVFRLPEGLRLLIRTGEPVSIKRTMRGFQAALGHELVITSARRLVVSSGRLFGDSPLKVKVWDGLTILQERELDKPLSESKYETTYQVSVTLLADGGRIQLALGTPSMVTVDGKAYTVMIKNSSKLIPNKEYEGLVEGSGYSIEYVAVCKE